VLFSDTLESGFAKQGRENEIAPVIRPRSGIDGTATALAALPGNGGLSGIENEFEKIREDARTVPAQDPPDAGASFPQLRRRPPRYLLAPTTYESQRASTHAPPVRVYNYTRD